MTTSWLYLPAAGIFQTGWPLGLKLATTPAWKFLGPALAVACMSATDALLWLALKLIPIGTAYAVWTGVGE